MGEKLLTVNHLQVQIHSRDEIIQPVQGVDFTLDHGEIFALVGESGCGKTITALSINRLLPPEAMICEGSEIYLAGLPLHQLSECRMRSLRGSKIAMIFQDPGLALNPVLTIGAQLQEVLPRSGFKKESRALLEKVNLPDPDVILTQYPHQLSGGMKQRVVIAIALAQSPDLLIADEATTALDVTTQAQVLHLIKELNKQLGMAVLLITHDLGVVKQMAETVSVMYAGHIIEKAPGKSFFDTARHPYSKKLLAALPDRHPGERLAVIPGQVPALTQAFPLCRFRGRCDFIFKSCEEVKPQWIDFNESAGVRCHWYDPAIVEKLPPAFRIDALEDMRSDPVISYENDENAPLLLKVEKLKVHFPLRGGTIRRAVEDVTLHLHEGETLSIVGGSGSGKTTLGKAILKLISPTSGKITLLAEGPFRENIQMIFQDPYSSMNPMMQVNEIIEEGMISLKIGSDRQERQDRIYHLLEQVGLSAKIRSRYPHELSGGQRQRVAIARALAVGAKILICDEPTSALDLSVQAQILNLLKSLQEDLGISYLFITHHIGVVRYLGGRIAVMQQGHIVEAGFTQEVLKSPQHAYTRTLLASLPSFFENKA